MALFVCLCVVLWHVTSTLGLLSCHITYHELNFVFVLCLIIINQWRSAGTWRSSDTNNNNNYYYYNHELHVTLIPPLSPCMDTWMSRAKTKLHRMDFSFIFSILHPWCYINHSIFTPCSCTVQSKYIGISFEIKAVPIWRWFTAVKAIILCPVSDLGATPPPNHSENLYPTVCKAYYI